MSTPAPTVGTIEKAEQSRSGKSVRIHLNGRWYSTKNQEMQNMVGQTISFVPDISDYQGKTYHWIGQYQQAGMQQGQQAGMQAPVSHPNPGYPSSAQPPASDPVAGGVMSAEQRVSLLPITSNVLANAIAGGFIDEPSKLKAWAQAAFASAAELVYDVKVSSDFDDDIPF